MTNDAELHSYMQDVGRHPVLSEEAQLLHCRNIHAWQNINTTDQVETNLRKTQRRGQHSMKVMVETNLRMVVSIAKRFQHKGLEFKDLIQEGNIGLIRGLELYDPARGYRISTYCYWWIRQGITRALHNHGRPIRLPLNHYETLNKVQRHSQHVEATTGTKPSLQELALFAGITTERMFLIVQRWAITEVVSLDRPGVEGGSDLVELLAAPDPPEDAPYPFHPSPSSNSSPSPGSTSSPLDPPAPLALPSSEHRQIAAAMRGLPPKERYVLEEIIIHEKSLQEVADSLLLSKSRIGQLLKSGKDSLRGKMGGLEGEG